MGNENRVSGRILGQISLMQSVVAQLPDKNSILKFVCQGFKDIPGVDTICSCPDEKPCDLLTSKPPDPKTLRHNFPIVYKEHSYANLCFVINHWDSFSPYIPFLENFSNMLSIIFEEKKQRLLNRNIMESLEKEVFKRTKELEAEINERKSAETALKHLRNYLSNIIDSMPSVIVGVDLEGRVTQWNKQAEKITGRASHQVIKKPLDAVLPRLADQMSSIKIAIGENRSICVTKLPRKEEREIRFEDVTIYPLASNGVEGAVIRIDDVTEAVRMQEVIVQSEKMLTVGGLAAGMAHEINNPLAGAIQNVNLLKNRLTDKNMVANIKAAESLGTTMDIIHQFMEQRSIPRVLDAIEKSGERIASIVNNMLSFARKSDAASSTHDPAALIDNILELASTDFDLKKHYDFKSILIEKEYEDHLPLMICESGKIQQVILNILNNGAHAMFETAQKNHPKFIIRLKKERASNMLRIEIEDNGPGMAPEISKRIFDPFFTTKPAGVGTGLGLSVSYFIITENHKGTLDVVSEPGKGATFIIRLPAG